jgi:YYY domain-containing protein
VSGLSAILPVVLLAGLWAAGTAVLLRAGRGDADEGGVRDGAIVLGPLIGLLLLGFPGWLATLAGPVSFGVVLGLGGAAALAALGAFGRELRVLGSRHALLPGGLLLALFGAFLWLRLGWPDARLTEKPMDLAVLSGLLATPRLPFEDPWFAGEAFPYYHFGTYLLALPFRLASVPPGYAYNLVAALVAALAGSAAFGVVRLRGGGRGPALGAALLLAFAGTFDGARQLLAGGSLASVDVWASSRRVADAITEWPLFTLWLGDLHPHVVALPLLLALAGAAVRFASGPGQLVSAALLAAVVSANPWDLPAALLLVAAGALATRPLRPALVTGVATLAVAIPFLLPSFLAARPEFLGLRGVSAATTSPEAFLHLGGLLLVPALAIGIALLRSRGDGEEAFLVANFFPALGILLSVITGRPVLGLGAAFLLAVLKLLPRLPGALGAGFLLAGAGVALLLVPELIAVRDPYGEELHRMNTVFKCYAAAAAILAPATALLAPLALATRRARWLVRGATALAALALLAHPASLLVQRVRAPRTALDGLAWMADEAPGDREAVEWIRRNAPPGARLVEAVGGAYSDHGRIGGATGRPIVLGWTNHEGLWRGARAAGEIEARRKDVETIYRSRDRAAVLEALARRGARYVVLGPLERKEHGEDALPVRDALKRVFGAKGTEVWEVTS